VAQRALIPLRMKKQFATLALVVVTGVVTPIAFVGCASSNDRDSHKRTAGQYIDDKVLAQKVRSSLGDNDIYKFPDVKVNTYKGTVQLTGFVDSNEQRTKAEEIVRNVNGVTSVQNNITMKSDTERVRGTDPNYRNTTPNTTAPNSPTRTP
jgi:hyperosmotically inducible protein